MVLDGYKKISLWQGAFVTGTKIFYLIFFNLSGVIYDETLLRIIVIFCEIECDMWKCMLTFFWGGCTHGIGFDLLLMKLNNTDKKNLWSSIITVINMRGMYWHHLSKVMNTLILKMYYIWRHLTSLSLTFRKKGLRSVLEEILKMILAKKYWIFFLVAQLVSSVHVRYQLM